MYGNDDYVGKSVVTSYEGSTVPCTVITAAAYKELVTDLEEAGGNEEDTEIIDTEDDAVITDTEDDMFDKETGEQLELLSK